MERPRRADRHKDRRRTWTAAAIMAGAGVLIAGILVAWAGARQPETVTIDPASRTPSVEATRDVSASADASATSVVEVPALDGLTPSAAKVLLEAAGLKMKLRTEGPSVETTASVLVRSQDPESGVVVPEGSVVTVGIPRVVAGSAPKREKAPSASSPRPAPTGWVVCIDPGHQARSDTRPEPIGPGASETKPRVMGGATGIETGLPEYEVVLQISMNLKEALERRGVKVVMTRTTNDVNLSNSERARIANRAKADLFVRVHGDGSPDSSTAGITTLYPGKTKWTAATTEPSRRAAQLVHRAVVAQTGAADRGVVARTDLSGFNYAVVPSILVECGFLSNPVEDKLLSSPHYQDKLAEGMAKGIIRYLESR